jgi:hypothetical protein
MQQAAELITRAVPNQDELEGVTVLLNASYDIGIFSTTRSAWGLYDRTGKPANRPRAF